jgi:hypothetical protein
LILAIAAAVAAVVGFVFAGHLELRYTMSPDPVRAPGYLSVMVGFGA